MARMLMLPTARLRVRVQEWNNYEGLSPTAGISYFRVKDILAMAGQSYADIAATARAPPSQPALPSRKPQPPASPPSPGRKPPPRSRRGPLACAGRCARARRGCAGAALLES